MILNYILPSSLIYKLVKPSYEPKAFKDLFINSNNNEIETIPPLIAQGIPDNYKKIKFNKKGISFFHDSIYFGGLESPSSIMTERKSINEDNITYMNSLYNNIQKDKNRIKLRAFSNGCNDLMMFLEFLEKNSSDSQSKYNKEAKAIINAISEISLSSPYRNFASSVKPFLNNLSILQKISAIILSPILLPILLISSLISKSIDIARNVDNSGVLSDKHLYNRFGKFLENKNISASIKYSVNDPKVGDFKISKKDKNGNYVLMDGFKKYKNIDIHVSEEDYHCQTQFINKIGDNNINNINMPRSNFDNCVINNANPNIKEYGNQYQERDLANKDSKNPISNSQKIEDFYTVNQDAFSESQKTIFYSFDNNSSVEDQKTKTIHSIQRS